MTDFDHLPAGDTSIFDGTDWYAAVPPPTVEASPRRSAGLVATTIVVVTLLVAGVASAMTLSGQRTNTPDQAVRALLTAAGNGDALGVLDHLDPAERDPLTNFFTNGTADLKRLGILSPAMDLGHIQGAAFTITDLTTDTTPLRPGISAVKLTGGSVHSRIDPATLPIGPFIHDVVGRGLASAKPSEHTQPLRSDTAIATIRRDGTWYVSIGYTAAEAARTAVKAAPPNAADAIPAIGADSATGAVDAFLHAAAGLDLRRIIELTPPDEMGALHDYAPLFLPKATDAVTKLQSGPDAVTVTITDLSLTGQTHPGGELVKIGRIGLHVASRGTTIDLAPGAKCITVTGTALASFPGVCGAGGAPMAPPASVLTGPLKALAAIHPETGVVVVKRDGKWFVSPTRTLLDNTEAVLHALSPEALQSLKSLFNPAALFGLAGNGTSGFSITSGGVTRRSTSPSAPMPLVPVGGAMPAITPCVNGTRTVTFPATNGASSPRPMTIPCRAVGGTGP